MSHAVHHISHAISKVVHVVSKPVEKLVSHVPIVGQPIAQTIHAIDDQPLNPIHAVKSVLSGANGIIHALTVPEEQVVANQSATVASPTSAPAAAAASNAAQVAIPQKEEEAETESASKKKKTISAGKKSLTIARSSGAGVNI